jgi:hypothetical protein
LQMYLYCSREFYGGGVIMFTITKSLVTPLFLTVLATLAGKVSHCFLLLFSFSYSSITTKQFITGWLQLAAQNLLIIL